MDVPHPGGVVRISHHNGIAFYHRAHGLAGFLRIFRGNRGDGGHENPVHAFFCQIPQMAVHQLGREAYGIGGDGGQAVLVDGSVLKSDSFTENPSFLQKVLQKGIISQKYSTGEFRWYSAGRARDFPEDIPETAAFCGLRTGWGFCLPPAAFPSAVSAPSYPWDLPEFLPARSGCW